MRNDEPGRLARKKRKKHRPLAFSAMETGDLHMLEMLLEKEPDLAHLRDLNGMSLIRTAAFQGHQDVIDLLRPTAGPLDAFEAAALGDTERLAEILDAGEAKPTDEAKEGFGLIHLCCLFGHEAAATMLLDRGVGLETEASHPLKVRPVHSAAAGRHHDLVRLLLDRGADATATQAGEWTLLHHAAQQDAGELAEDLLARGLDPAAKNERGHTPADIARGLGHAELAERLSR